MARWQKMDDASLNMTFGPDSGTHQLFNSVAKQRIYSR
jgi:hypothetical protein